MSFWSDLSKATAPTGDYANLDPATLQSTIQSLLAQQAANGGANADPVFARELEKAGYMGGASPNLPQMDITDYNYAGPNTAKVNGQPVTYAALGQGYGEYRQDPNSPNEYFSYSPQGDNSRSQAYGIDPSGQYIVMSKPQMTPPPAPSNSGFADSFMDFLPMAATFAGGVSGLQGLGALPAGGSGAFAVSDPFLGEASVLGGGGTINPAVSYPVNALAPPVPFTNAVENFGATNTAYPEAVAGTSAGYPGSDPFLGETSVLGGGGAMPPAVPVGSNPFLGEASVLGGGGTTAPITPGLIQQLANYTGLSTGAIAGLGGVAISSLAGLYGAGMVGSAADRAAKGIADANANSNALLAAIDARNKAREEPFYQAGLNALPTYTKGVMPGGDLVRPFSMADYQADPGYGFRMSEGMKALDRSAASRGSLLSGATLKGAQRYGQDLASTEYDRAYNRYGSDQATRRNALASLTGFAPTASSAIRSSDMAYGGNATNLASNTANAMAGAGATRASAYGNALAGIGQNAYNALNPNPFAQYMQRQLGA